VTELPEPVSTIDPFIGESAMERLSLQEGENKISSLLSDIERNGKSFTVCRNRKPVAELIPTGSPVGWPITPFSRESRSTMTLPKISPKKSGETLNDASGYLCSA
jgi:antitoxin (DNA-binding transcriptional repressor) of toxin-antitoxin stability system